MADPVRASEVLTGTGIDVPLTDENLSSTCEGCGTTQTLAEARLETSDRAFTYFCHKCDTPLLLVLPGPGNGRALDVRGKGLLIDTRRSTG
jgi:hypothetical protein